MNHFKDVGLNEYDDFPTSSVGKHLLQICGHVVLQKWQEKDPFPRNLH